MPKISVITPTVRPEGLALVAKALKRQTFKDFEWIITSPDFAAMSEKSPKPRVDLHYLNDPEKEPGDYWALNKAYNQAIDFASGDLIVSWQDWTFAKPDALEKFWHHFASDNKKVVSGVGNKYENDEFIVETWRDPRMRDDQGTLYPCYPADIEFNFAAIPKAAFYDVGGFDESLDKYAGMDGYSVVDRLGILVDQGQASWDFYLDQTNKSFSLEHGRLPDWDKKNALGPIYQKKHEEYLANPRLAFLQLK